MPLHILLILVVGGIAGIALALHLLGMSRPIDLDQSRARLEWLRHYPDDSFDTNEAFEFLTNIRGDRAIVRSDQGYGLVWVMGADTAARRMDGTTWQETKTGVRFDTRDPSAPHIAVRLQDDERHLWLSYLRKFHGS